MAFAFSFIFPPFQDPKLIGRSINQSISQKEKKYENSHSISQKKRLTNQKKTGRWMNTNT